MRCWCCFTNSEPCMRQANPVYRSWRIFSRTSCWRHQSGFLSTECTTPSKYKLILIIAPIVITKILFISKAIHNVDLICSLLNMQCSVLFLGYAIIPRWHFHHCRRYWSPQCKFDPDIFDKQEDLRSVMALVIQRICLARGWGHRAVEQMWLPHWSAHWQCTWGCHLGLLLFDFFVVGQIRMIAFKCINNYNYIY